MIELPIEAVLPHAGPAIVLDRVEHVDEDAVICVRTVRPGTAFTAPDGSLPAWAGVELMAQAIAAWAGCHARRDHREVPPGFLLGTRHYRCEVEAFPPGTVLRIHAQRQFHDDNGMGVFHCRIEADTVLAQARLTVFSPPQTGATPSSPIQEPTT